MFGIYTLIESTVFFLNAICILHEERFLKKYGLAATTQNMQSFDPQEATLKQKVVNIISSVKGWRTMSHEFGFKMC